MPPCKFNPFKFKVSIVGCGNVGASAAYAMLLDGTPTHLTLIDLCKERAEGLMLDMEHTLAFVDYTELKGSNNIEDCKDSNVVFITAGVPQKPGQSRLELIEINRKIFKTLIPAIVKAAPQAILVIVSNPVDVLTYEAIKLAKLPKGRVFGTGTINFTLAKNSISVRRAWKPMFSVSTGTVRSRCTVPRKSVESACSIFQGSENVAWKRATKPLAMQPTTSFMTSATPVIPSAWSCAKS
jgi:hypothetical protein